MIKFNFFYNADELNESPRALTVERRVVQYLIS
jgi:hypothetical protein